MKRQPSASEKSLFQKTNETIVKVGAATGIALSALALSACSETATEAPATTSTSSASPSATPEAVAPKPEHKFSGTVNYDSFVGFAEMNETAQDVVCAEFYNANLPGSTISEYATGMEVAQWQADHLLVLTDLNTDTSDPRNQEVAINIVECLTSDHDLTADAKTTLLQALKIQNTSGLEGYELGRINPAQVTRYSDGTFQVTGQTYGDYAAFTMEGRVNNLGEGRILAVYEWNGSTTFPAFKLVADQSYSPGDSLPAGGKPPIVVDQAFANEPWE